jgi:hypothetical protein
MYICPYPGLRPFNEDEAIFFKGRDNHVESIIRQLEERKLVMITGSSGDGKSSLVYAGVLPNARAGFFRARFANWLIADFRPERAPLRNFSQRMAEVFELPAKEVHQRLKYGFSSLVDLYTETPFFISEEDEAALPEGERKHRRDHAANLLIVADQFEELFTNSENFANDTPSDEACVLVNLLLETARLSIDRGLPVYVLFTMRSDYISQSGAFKGLPEAISYSEFFVPRLQRKELQEAIKQPAELSGCKVSDRLCEHLINELHEGFDQLPVIQHTLNRLWYQAEGGKYTLDLLHLAKVAGLPPDMLPPADQEEYQRWEKGQNPVMKAQLAHASLSNVLDTHANLLYAQAHEHARRYDWLPKSVTEEQAQVVFKNAFQSLARTDNNRLVRNRVSLQQISRIIQRDDIGIKEVCAVLNIMRLNNNTFLKPFLSEDDPSTEFLSGSTVLDITHEALIRNWQQLREWQNEEHQNYQEFLDFRTQLELWEQNDRAKAYLLASGPLEHFEAWFAEARPNKYWVAKYLEDPQPGRTKTSTKLKEAEKVYYAMVDYLQASRQQVDMQRKAARRRATIAAVAAGVVILILSGLSYWAFEQKNKAQKQEQLAQINRREAEAEKNRAIEATKEASEAKQRAESNAYRAMLAKLQSDSARKMAMRLQQVAENERKRAENQAEEALEQKQRAEKQRKIAEQERRRALSASDSAKRLTYQALTQTLALKAREEFYDPQLNLLLAHQAYKFNQQFGEGNREPTLYQAQREALLKSGEQAYAKLESGETEAVYPATSGQMHVLTEDARWLRISTDDYSVKSEQALQGELSNLLQARFISDEQAVVEDRRAGIFLVQDGGQSTRPLKGQKGRMTSAAKAPSGQWLATSDVKGNVYVWETNSTSTQPIFKYSLGTQINVLVWQSDNLLWAGLRNGELVRCTLGYEETDRLRLSSQACLSLLYDAPSDLLVSGYANGRLFLIRPDSFLVKREYQLAPTGVSHLTVMPDTRELAAATLDRRVHIFSLGKPDAPRYEIANQDEPLISLRAQDESLFGLTQSNRLYRWRSLEAYNEEVRKSLRRNFTREEWERLVGEDIPYRQTLPELETAIDS